MKSLSKIIFYFLLNAAGIILLTLFFNLFLYIAAAFRMVRSSNVPLHNSRMIARELTLEEDVPVLSETGYQLLEEAYVWAMLLSDDGDVIWDWKLPDELNRNYTSSDIAVFSKWYLEDYPVIEYITDYGLLVVAYPKDSIWKYNISESLDQLNFTLTMIPIVLIANLFFVFLLVLFFGSCFYRSLRCIAVGIERLSRQKTIHLPEKGMNEILARQLNQTSSVLEQQRTQLKRRDDARTAWISGVSHDIRTPLSLIMGYAATLKMEQNLTDKQRQQAEIIESQSLQIKQLIEDLNLTSKLEYEMQPLRLTTFQPAALLRKIVSDFYNQNLTERHEIELYIDPDIEQTTLTGDENLLTRAFRNLIQNSIRHNPNGCTILLTAYPDKDRVCFQVSDDGCGIPDEVIALLEKETDSASVGAPPDTDDRKTPHIMGLRIVRQIFTAHGWEMKFANPGTIWILSETL